MLEGPELDSLAADIRTNGLQHPIVTHEGAVLDGRNRFAACRLAGVEPRFVAWNGRGSPITWVLSTNLHRRHLNEGQRAMAAARSLPLLAEEAKERHRANGGDRKSDSANLPEQEKGRAREHAAKLLNVSPRSVEAAANVIKHATPAVIKAVDAGKLAVSAAAELTKLPVAKQTAIMARVATGSGEIRGGQVRAYVKPSRPGQRSGWCSALSFKPRGALGEHLIVARRCRPLRSRRAAGLLQALSERAASIGKRLLESRRRAHGIRRTARSTSDATT